MSAPVSALRDWRSTRYPDRRGLVLSNESLLPTADGCESLAADGFGNVRLAGPIDLRTSRSLDAVRFIRDCVAVGITVDWSVSQLGTIEPETLTHLYPPSTFPGHDALLSRWRDFAFGVLYWRRGPDFAIVRDVRPAWEPSFTTLERDGTLECFTRLSTPCAVSSFKENERDGLASLERAHLVLRIENHAVALPYRIRRWPVPFMAV